VEPVLTGICIEDRLKFSEQAVCTLVHLSKAATYILQSVCTVHRVENDGQSQTGCKEVSFFMSYMYLLHILAFVMCATVKNK